MGAQRYGYQERTNPSLEFLETSAEDQWSSQFLSNDLQAPVLFNDGAESGHKLFAAILNRAVRDYKQYLWRPDPGQAQLAVDAWTWLMSDDESFDLTTFVDVCKLLDQNPDQIRKLIAKLVEYERPDSITLPVAHAA